tara:strand:- start:1 stop:210 length:210 start_codon:yes stop_codon:yes gene_type:complete
MYLQCFGLKELPFSLKPKIHFFILSHKVVMVGFVKEGYQVQADHIALAVDDTKGVALPPQLSIALFILH